ncbi:hypothetical protein [Brevundimonas vesicularis]|uniref:hypothetical protein n=1 Tax=Brevundimonas vesicularis TaxID=41276 RepID=UPI0038D375BE
MTKNLLLSAAALGVLAFAGSAAAGQITSASVSGETLTVAVDGTVTPYAVASEVVFPAGGLSVDAATTSVTTELTSNVSLGGGASLTLIVSYDLTGNAQFGSINFADLEAFDGAAAPVAISSGAASLSNNGKTATFIVSYNLATATEISGFTLDNIDLDVLGTGDVSIASSVRMVVGATETTLDTTSAQKLVTFKSAFVAPTAEAGTAVAALPSFLAFEAQAGAGFNVTTTNVVSEALNLTLASDVFADLQAAPLSLDDMIDTATVTVTGKQVQAFDAEFGGIVVDADGEIELETAGELALLTTGRLDLQADGTTPIEAGTYRVKVAFEPETGFQNLPTYDIALANIELDGTNFIAPWFALNNGTANSTLRLANNGSTTLGPVVISLKANNGAAAPTGTYTIEEIEGGKFVSVTGATLKTAFGTNAGNGDLLVTIHSNDADVSAKVRTTQSTGQIYENSLGRSSQTLVD